MEGFGGEWNVFVNENENEVVLTTSVGEESAGEVMEEISGAVVEGVMGTVAKTV